MSDRSYVPLHVHSFYSLLDGLPSPKRIVERAKEIGCPAIALTDHGSIFGMVAFQNAAKKAGIKPIIGIELYLCPHDPSARDETNRKHSHLTVLAQNQKGVETLMALVSETNRPDWFYRKPRIDLANLARFTKDGNLLCLSGCLVGELSVALFADHKEACRISSLTGNREQVRALLRDDWKDLAAEVVERYQGVFGKDNYYIEIQEEGMAVQRVVVECLRDLAKKLGVPTVATLDSHYACKEDAEDQRILLYAQMHTTAEEQQRLRSEGGDTMEFFASDEFYIFAPDEMAAHYTEAELQASLEIAERCSPPKLGHAPCLPKFENDDFKAMQTDSDGYLKKLCLEGAAKELGHLAPEIKERYRVRLRYELAVIREAKLADYFLIVWDACQFVDRSNGPRGKGRGSGAGCLVNYLVGITDIDPLVYGLYFERFYNASRNIPAHFEGSLFMKWYGDHFNEILGVKPDADRRRVAALVALHRDRIRNQALLKAEAQWIDEHSPRMWQYLWAIQQGITEYLPEETGGNPANSHILHAMGRTDQLDPHQPVKTVCAHVSLPDIDTDIGVVFRARVIEYLTQRWGADKVSQMITFGRLQGKAALKEVFRAQPETVRQLMRVRALKLGQNPNDLAQKPHDLCNEITQYIPDEAAIADDLQQAREETGNDRYGILQWSIDNIKEVADAYEWYRPLFDQAMRLEGTKKSQSKHAAGIVIADRPIAELVPLAYDPKSKTRVCGLEMGNAETMGCVKFDFLGVTALDKLWFGQALVNQHSAKLLLDGDLEAVED